LQAAVANAEAAVELAKIDLQNTEIHAPRDGKLGEVGVRIGQYVAAGTQLMAVVPHDVWVVANFKETQLGGMEAGQVVSISVDALHRRKLTGKVERFAPAAGSEFAVIKPDNATGNFVKIVQRLPVRIELTRYEPDKTPLFVGLSVVPYVYCKEPPAGPHAGEVLEPLRPLPQGPTVSGAREAPQGVAPSSKARADLEG
jgi:multidrug resistance efflux pump